MQKKHCFTLLEIMIVIFLIGIIGSIIGYNMTGTLEKGKAFKTEQAKDRLQDLLELQLAEGVAEKRILEKPEEVIKELGIVKNTKDLLKDGWGEPFSIIIQDGEIKVTSTKLHEYNKKHGIQE